jgi:hypothetical protein
MVKNIVILKSISFLFLGLVFYMHVCSAWCAMSSGGGCSKQEKTSCHKTCCTHHQKSNNSTGDCQDFHLSFFNAAGQFASEKSVLADKSFPVVIPEIPNLIISIPVPAEENLSAFNNYHPPQPIEDIRVFMRSFQI